MIANKNQNKQLTQLDKANLVLQGLRKDVTTEDREAAINGLDGFSEPTISRYLNGEAKKIHKAMELIRFFKNRIADRERELAA